MVMHRVGHMYFHDIRNSLVKKVEFSKLLFFWYGMTQAQNRIFLTFLVEFPNPLFWSGMTQPHAHTRLFRHQSTHT